MYRALFLCAVLAVTPSFAADKPLDEGARNLEILARYHDLGQKRDFQAQAALWSPDAVNQGRPMNPDAIGAQLEDLYRTFPDFKTSDLETEAAGDTIVVLQRATGTHRGVARTGIYGGMLAGAKPTGKRFDVLVTHWWRFKDGKIVWHYAVRDELGMMRQLGLIAGKLPADKLVR